ncbi:hypothetical protein PsYK624_003540 [Phanerochaete sordida]|uniref:Uncharacterized protein n=1 Tax=Phanerochaete sordida TaxID=48140 RepID=A0A9P3FXA8_9APHY|nr:hypothetical protein PsYK624_003540 [Phanerochaete sordida]
MDYAALKRRPSGSQEDRGDSWFSWSSYRAQAVLCVATHALLILAHIALLVVCEGKYEHRVTFALTPRSVKWYPLIATTTVQVIGTITLSVLVAGTQSLAFRRNLYVRQTLTALHDRSYAWMSQGAALKTLWQQLKLQAAAVGVAYIAAYLFGVWVLHITIPGVVDVVPYNATVSTVQRTTLANLTTQNASFASTYDVLSVYDQMALLGPGLQENIVYDVIPQVPSAVGNTTVNASVYTVECAAYPTPIPTLTASSFYYFMRDYSLDSVFMGPADVISPFQDLNATNIPFIATFPFNSTMIYTAQATGCEPGDCSVPIVLLSPLPILDSSGSEAPLPGGAWVPIQPVITVDTGDLEMMTALQLLACNVNISNVHINVSVDTRLPIGNISQPQEGALWSKWTLPDNATLTDQLRFAQNQPLFSPPSSHGSATSVAIGNSTLSGPAAAPVVFDQGWYAPQTGMIWADVPGADLANSILQFPLKTMKIMPTAFDMFLNEDLGLVAQNRTSVGLADINHSLAKTLAALAWYANRVDYSGSHSTAGIINMPSIYSAYDTPPLIMADANIGSGPLPYGEAQITIQVQRLQLNFSFVPIVVGLVASVGLLILALLMIRRPARERAAVDSYVEIDSGGLLQYTWLLGNEPHLAQVSSPELANLRAAGMFDVNIGDRVRRRVDSRAASTASKEEGYAYGS